MSALSKIAITVASITILSGFSPAHAAVPPESSSSIRTGQASVVTLNASKTSVTIGRTVRLSGKVKGRSPRAKVILQQARPDGGWSKIATGKVSHKKTYRFKTYVQIESNSFRVKVKKNSLIGGGTSPEVSVTGVKEQVETVDNELEVARAAILKETNDYRIQNGLPALLPMDELNTVAQNWTETMAAEDSMYHNPNFFNEYPQNFYAGGENVAYGYGLNDVVEAWINSPGHRANILGKGYTHIGLGYAVTPDGTPYFTQNFAG